MKKIIIFLILSIIIFNCQLFIILAQTWKELPDSVRLKIKIPASPNRTDEKGLKQGQWTILLGEMGVPTTDSLKASSYRLINYMNGKPDGIVTDFYITGTKQMEGYLKSENPDTLDGITVFFHPNGLKKSEGKFDNGTPVEEWKCWNEDGKEDKIEQMRFKIEFLNKKGRTVEALTVCQEVLKLIKEEYLGDYSQYAKRLNTIANTYMELNETDLAVPLYKEALDTLRNNGDTAKSEYLQYLDNLAEAYFHMKKYDLAEPIYKQSLEIKRKKYGEESPEFCETLNYLADTYLLRGRFEEGEKLYKQSLDLYKKNLGEDNLKYIKKYFKLGILYVTKQRYEQALPIFQEVLEILKKKYGEESPEYAEQLFNLSILYGNSGKYEQFVTTSKRVIELQKKLLGEENPAYLKNVKNIADRYEELGKYDLAEPLLERALESGKKVYGENHPEYADIMSLLANVYFSYGKLDSAEKLINQAQMIFKKTVGEENLRYYGNLSRLQIIYSKKGKLDLAEQIALKALEFAKKKFGVESRDYANCLNNLGDINTYLEKYEQAIKYISQAIEINKKLQNPDLHVSIANLSKIYIQTGKYELAEPLLNDVLEKIKNKYGEEHPDYYICLAYLSQLYISSGRFELAEKIIKQIMEYDRKKFGENNSRYSVALNNLGIVYIRMKKYELAEQMLTRAMDINKNLFGEENLDYLTNLNGLATVYYNTEQYKLAEKYSKNALDIINRKFGENNIKNRYSLSNLGNIYIATEKYDLAEPICLQLNKMIENNLGKEHPEFEITINKLGCLYDLNGKTDLAIAYYDESYIRLMNFVYRYFPYFNEDSKLSFWNKEKIKIHQFNLFFMKYYEKKPELLGKMYDMNIATKGIILNSTQKTMKNLRNIRNKFETWQSTRQLWLQLVQNPQKAKKMSISVDSLSKVAGDLESELSKESIDFKKTYDTSKTHWRDIRKKLNSSEAAVEIIRIDKIKIGNKPSKGVIYAALILKPAIDESRYSDSIELVILNNGDELEEKYFPEYKSLIDKQKNRTITKKELDAKSSELYNQFWKPIAQKLKGVTSTYISFDGIYNQINLNPLRNPKTGKYIIDEIDLRIVTNTKDLVENMTETGKPRGNFADLFGDPKYNLKVEIPLLKQNDDKSTSEYSYLSNAFLNLARQGITPLPGTKIEVDKISAGLREKNWEIKEFTGDAALEENLKSVNNPRILHIATHGVFLKDVESATEISGMEEQKTYIANPLLRSMLLLAGAENTLANPEATSTDKDDGILTAYEAMNLDLDNTELVVLSACETGLGEVRNGEGVYGLQRAFQVAGAKSLIMSLWSVSDEATQELMTSFYNKWLSGRTKREAFRDAQMEMKEKYPGFYYWGAFVMVGE